MECKEKRIASVEGWLELGDSHQAQDELLDWPSFLQNTPEAIRLWMNSCVLAKDWQAVKQFANRLKAMEPEDEEAAFYAAESLHRLGQTSEAIRALTASAEVFDDKSTILYTVARYRCALSEMDAALSLLGQAFLTRPALRRKAMGDPELIPLRAFLLDDDRSFMAQPEPEL